MSDKIPPIISKNSSTVNAKGHHVLHYQSFDVSSGGHGGMRRTSQIAELLNRYSISSTQLDSSAEISSIFTRIGNSILNKSLLLHVIRKNLSNPINETYRLSLIRQRLSSISDTDKKPIPIVWEATKDEGFILLFNDRHPVIALPHNIESFAEQNFSCLAVPNNTVFRSLAKEASIFRKCAHVFCISREDQWILANLGVKSRFLPYWPCQDILESCAQIRRNRELLKPSKNFILILGTAYNPPTRYGIQSLVYELSKVPDQIGINIVIAGFGTEKLKFNFPLPGCISIAGTLPEDELMNLMNNTLAVLVHQDYGSGAITKIVECALAGIPVIANEIASRTFYNTDGLWPYADVTEIGEIARRITDSIPACPSRPIKYEEAFIRAVLTQ